jgi:hypothetical protein
MPDSANIAVAVFDAQTAKRKPSPANEELSMDLSLAENPMVWVVVRTEGGAEQFVGQQHTDLDITFIPFFAEKEAAQDGLHRLKREKGRRYEVQAVRFRELARDAARHGFLLFHTAADGHILNKIDPHTVA